VIILGSCDEVCKSAKVSGRKRKRLRFPGWLARACMEQSQSKLFPSSLAASKMPGQKEQLPLLEPSPNSSIDCMFTQASHAEQDRDRAQVRLQYATIRFERQPRITRVLWREAQTLVIAHRLSYGVVLMDHLYMRRLSSLLYGVCGV
jgi:hypothetical protein